MRLPFTVDRFFEVFSRYNTAVWPAQPALLALAVLALTLLLWRPRATSGAVSAILATFWAWMAIAYHLLFFAKINPTARVFALFFLVEAAVFLALGVVRRRLVFRRPSGVRGALGLLLVAYSLAVYPALGWLAGHRYPAMPTFGVPCPTTIWTLGMLLFLRPPLPWWVAAVPVAWAAVGSTAAFALDVPQDLGLLVAGVVALGAWVWPRQGMGAGA